VGASSEEQGFFNLIAQATGMEPLNFAVQGTSMEKRVPIDLISSPNAIDDTANIPIWDSSYALMIIEWSTNDIIINSPNYNATNFITDGTTFLNKCVSKGWDSSKLFLQGPFWLGSQGFTQGSGITGTPAATLARQDSFVNAMATLAKNFKCLYVDTRAAQRQFDTTHIMASDQLHPNDFGHRSIAAIDLQYLF